MRLEGLVDAGDEGGTRERVAREGALGKQIVGEHRAWRVAPRARNGESRERGSCAASGIDERRHLVTEHEVASAEPGLEVPGDLDEGQRLSRLLVVLRIDATDDEHEAAALHADEHIRVEMASRAPQ